MPRFNIRITKFFLPTKNIITKDEHMVDQALQLLSSDVEDFPAREQAFETLQKIYRSGEKKVKKIIKLHCEEACS